MVAAACAQDIDAVYFGDGAVNDLDDWSNFLEVPDFMASFNCSQVREWILFTSSIYHASLPR